MLKQLKDSLGKQVSIELVNGNKISGTLLEIDEKNLRIETDQGVATIAVTSVQVVWDNHELSLAETDMKEIVEKLKDDAAEARYQCLGANGFRCSQSYTCRPPHACNNFACPGLFNTAFVPPDEPCVAQFFGFKRQAKSSSKNKDKKGNKHSKHKKE